MLWYERALVTTLVAVGAVAVASGSGCGRSDDVAGAPPASGTTGAGGMGTGGGGFGGDVTNFEPCAEVRSEATLVDVNMFVAVDKSGSMETDMKWDNTQAAFTSFFQSADAAYLNVALRLWPDDFQTCTGPDCCVATEPCDGSTVVCPATMLGTPTCVADACGTPQVPLGALTDSAHQQALIDLFNATMPNGSTPMSAVMEGAVLWARAQLNSAPEEAVVIVLVTDGEPNDCNDGTLDGSAADVDYVAQIAADAFNTDGILTYAVGLQGSQEPSMNQIATAGGTTDGYFIGSGNAEQDLLTALLDIAGKSAACTFPIPPPENPGDTLDPKLVRVEYNGIMNHVENEAACGADGGWYYDDNANPTTITLCPDTCTTVQADAQAQIDVALGCECETNDDCPGDMICVDHHCRPPCQDDSDCPDGMICFEAQCIPEPGDPCENDTQCPAPLVCMNGQCSPDGRIYVGPFEAVQGGAFTCSAGSGRQSLAWLAAALAGLAFVTRRRRIR